MAWIRGCRTGGVGRLWPDCFQSLWRKNRHARHTYAGQQIAEGKSDFGVIKEAIRVVNPAPDLLASTALNRLTGRFRQKHGPRERRDIMRFRDRVLEVLCWYITLSRLCTV